MTREAELRRLLADVFRWTYLKNLTTTMGGNASVRLDEETILITPSGMPKHMIKPANIVKMRLDGTVQGGAGRPSSEWRMHVEIYKTRDDVRAVLHVHPPHVIALYESGYKLDLDIVELKAYVGPTVPEVGYLAPGSQELAEAVARALRPRNIHAVVLRKHGIVTVGSNILEALNRAEVLDQAAYMAILRNLLTGGK
ncbi:MAG: class II aldolase/adducin family protein [Crenarchaeota archaeon]|nr:class II aldolase/adducin family protein [Thermoproteota archaeon]